MRMNDGELLFHDLEMHRNQLLQAARIERLARKAQEDPSQVQRGWGRLVADLMDSVTTMVTRKARTDGLGETSMPIDPQTSGFETI